VRSRSWQATTAEDLEQHAHEQRDDKHQQQAPHTLQGADACRVGRNATMRKCAELEVHAARGVPRSPTALEMPSGRTYVNAVVDMQVALPYGDLGLARGG
jgi:hypothetical protein